MRFNRPVFLLKYGAFLCVHFMDGGNVEEGLMVAELQITKREGGGEKIFTPDYPRLNKLNSPCFRD